MFGNKKQEENRKIELDRMFDAVMDTTSDIIREAHNEIMDLVFAISLSAGVKAKKVVDNFTPEKLAKYADELHQAVNHRLESIKKVARKVVNVYDEPTPKKVNAKRKNKKVQAKGYR